MAHIKTSKGYLEYTNHLLNFGSNNSSLKFEYMATQP